MIYRNDLLRAEIYPDSTNEAVGGCSHEGDSGLFERVEYRYNRFGEVVRKKDQNETVHEYEVEPFHPYLDLGGSPAEVRCGRLAVDRVTILGPGIDAGQTGRSRKSLLPRRRIRPVAVLGSPLRKDSLPPSRFNFTEGRARMCVSQMTITRWVYPLIVFVGGLGLGVLWSPLERPHTPDKRALSDVQAQNETFVATMREMYGDETAEFVKQFEDMSIRIKQYPIDAWASPDGRFVIRLFGSEETIASDLRHPDTGGVGTELNRHYSFSSGSQTISIDVGRNIDNSKMTNVVFSFVDAAGGKLVYVDANADGRWDGFSDRTREPPVLYERDGLRWKQREVVGPELE